MFDATGLTDSPAPVPATSSYLLPFGTRTLTFALAQGAIQLTAEPSVLDEIKNQVTAND